MVNVGGARQFSLLSFLSGAPNADFARSVDGDVAAFGWGRKSGYERR
jgi:hypothetical protein